jgi:hypothetical protein
MNEIWQFDLRRGASKHPRDGACLLDAVSWFEYGKLGDHPPCVCPVLAAYGRGINDAMSDTDRQRLKPYIIRLAGTVDPAAEVRRAEFLAWQAIRVFAPLALDAAGLDTEAARLRAAKGSLAEAAAEAEAAARVAEAASAAGAWAARVDAMLSAFDGALAIGRQSPGWAETLQMERVRQFEEAR